MDEYVNPFNAPFPQDKHLNQLVEMREHANKLKAKMEHVQTCLRVAANNIGDSGWVEVAPQWLLWLAECLDEKKL